MIKILQSELSTRDEWVKAHIAGDDLPFSFYYGKRSAKDLLPTWKRNFSQSEDGDGITRYDACWTDPETGLEVTCKAASYPDYPVIEWTVYFKNNGQENTPILENIQSLDVQFDRHPDPGEIFLSHKKYILRAFRGDTCSRIAYGPETFDLDTNRSVRFSPPGGKPTGGAFPYFNLQIDDRGVITVIGWPGQWAASFKMPYFGSTPVSVAAGQDITCLSLRPGEEIRSPLSLLMFYEGGYIRSQNVWRRFMLDYNTPKYGGEFATPFTLTMSSLFQTEESELDGIRRCAEGGNLIDYWWMDAGWFQLPPSNEWFDGCGTWEADKARFPNGIRPIADAAHANGMKLVLWFEPERVYKDTWLYNNHPEWLFKNDFPGWCHYAIDKNSHLLNLGNPEALEWVINHIDRLVNEIGFDLFRLDFCCDPLTYWRSADAADRQGMAENAYVQGFLKFLDELRSRHPGLIIDSCAGGGQRFDLETARRSLLFTMTDYWPGGGFADDGNAYEGHQCIRYGLAHWFPEFGSGSFSDNTYELLSSISPICMGVPLAWMDGKPIGTMPVSDMVKIWREAVGSLYGDFYPLTGYSYTKDVWMAFQFDLPEAGEGIVIAYRRDCAEAASMAFKLDGLEAEAEYCVTDMFTGAKAAFKGAALMDGGLKVDLPEPRSAVLLKYKK